MADRSLTNSVPSSDMGEVLDSMMKTAKDSRRSYERRWYDNNFFDDGFHFRYLSRSQNKIIDLSERQTIYNPIRAIPKASRQIRGLANLLLSSDPTPIVYPEKVNMAAYPPQIQLDPETGQQIKETNPELKEAQDEAKRVAKLTGHWIEEEFKRQGIMEKLAQMAILAAKHGVSYMQIWPDSVHEEIQTSVYDAFDIYLQGNLTDIYDSPYIIKAVPKLISQIKADPRFDQNQIAKISPDNKMASSEIKEAYMRARFGGESKPDNIATLILKEGYIKEYLNDDNRGRISRQKDGSEILKGKEDGDEVIRQVFGAGNVWLKDTYVKLPDYPFVDFRMEPGPIYQVPIIERFIPANKSLDMIASRVERYTHTMVTGSWMKAKSEGNLNITNQAGGQIVEYTAIPPVQNAIAPIPSFVFSFMQFLNSTLEEQGVTTTTLGKVPAGVKSGVAIEALKESEYSNLVISSRRLKGTVKKIAEKMLDLADDYFVTPQTVYYLEKGEPQYFDVIGSSAMNKRKELKVDEEPLDVIPLKRDYRVEIEVQSGAAYTKEGKKEAAKQMMDQLLAYAQAGFLPPEAIKVAFEKYFEMNQFGATDEFMEALENYQQEGQMTDQQMEKIKVAVLEVMKDLQGAGVLPTSEQRIEEGKVATAEVIRDAGLAGKQEEPVEERPPSESISFKDLPPEGKVQMASQAGIQLDANQIRQDEQEQQQQEAEMKDREISLKEKSLEVKSKGGNNAASKR